MKNDDLKKIEINIKKYPNGVKNIKESITYTKIEEFDILKPITNLRGLFAAIQQIKSANGDNNYISRNPQPKRTKISPEELKLRNSPDSPSGKVFEWDRGVIAIGEDGIIKKYNLDNPVIANIVHHAEATVKLAELFGITVEQDGFNPVVPAISALNQGLVIIQTEGSSLFAYIPNNTTIEQASSLISCLIPRKRFEMGYAYDGELNDDVEIDEMRQVIIKSLEAKKKARRVS